LFPPPYEAFPRLFKRKCSFPPRISENVELFYVFIVFFSCKILCLSFFPVPSKTPGTLPVQRNVMKYLGSRFPLGFLICSLFLSPDQVPCPPRFLYSAQFGPFCDGFPPPSSSLFTHSPADSCLVTKAFFASLGASVWIVHHSFFLTFSVVCPEPVSIMWTFAASCPLQLTPFSPRSFFAVLHVSSPTGRKCTAGLSKLHLLLSIPNSPPVCSLHIRASHASPPFRPNPPRA